MKSFHCFSFSNEFTQKKRQRTLCGVNFCLIDLSFSVCMRSVISRIALGACGFFSFPPSLFTFLFGREENLKKREVKSIFSPREKKITKFRREEIERFSESNKSFSTKFSQTYGSRKWSFLN